jgi:hypothetical protein
MTELPALSIRFALRTPLAPVPVIIIYIALPRSGDQSAELTKIGVLKHWPPS